MSALKTLMRQGELVAGEAKAIASSAASQVTWLEIALTLAKQLKEVAEEVQEEAEVKEAKELATIVKSQAILPTNAHKRAQEVELPTTSSSHTSE